MFREITGGINAPKGFKSAGINCGIKQEKKDLALIFSEAPCNVAATFTSNIVKAAPVQYDQKIVAKGRAQAIIINTGNANCCTGKRGYNDAVKMAKLTAKELGISSEKVLVCSTGIIGRFLPMDKITAGIPIVARKLSSENFMDAAEAIMTTDLVTKHIAVEFGAGKTKVIIGAIAKGSGMIQPNMATMLCFIGTDAVVNPHFMRKALKEAVSQSFNRITVDGDMSTNDTVILMANGLAGNDEISAKKYGKLFVEALNFICRVLAQKIVRDGEGATKFITIHIKNAKTIKEADKAARMVANSPLVKTAIYGENPNWGRMMAALGASGALFSPGKVNIFIDRLQVVKSGIRAEYDEEDAREIMRKKEINILINLGVGRAESEIWTCDFSHKYVDINI